MSNENQEVVTVTLNKYTMWTQFKLQLFGMISWAVHTMFMVLGLAMIVGLLHAFGFIDAYAIYRAVCEMCGR